MKRFALLALASGMAIAAATPANAAIVIGYSLNGGAINTVVTSTTGSASYAPIAAVDGYFFNVGATGFPILTQPDLLTQSINVRQAADATTSARSNVLSVYITQTDLNAFTGSLMSSFTSQLLTGSAASATLSSFISSTNQLFTGTLLNTATFGSIGTSTGTSLIAGATPFSTTVRYDLTFNGAAAGTFNGTVNLAGTAVPEPATWGMMIVGFGLMGGVLRRRKTTVAFA